MPCLPFCTSSWLLRHPNLKLTHWRHPHSQTCRTSWSQRIRSSWRDLRWRQWPDRTSGTYWSLCPHSSWKGQCLWIHELHRTWKKERVIASEARNNPFSCPCLTLVAPTSCLQKTCSTTYIPAMIGRGSRAEQQQDWHWEDESRSQGRNQVFHCSPIKLTVHGCNFAGVPIGQVSVKHIRIVKPAYTKRSACESVLLVGPALAARTFQWHSHQRHGGSRTGDPRTEIPPCESCWRSERFLERGNLKGWFVPIKVRTIETNKLFGQQLWWLTDDTSQAEMSSLFSLVWE